MHLLEYGAVSVTADKPMPLLNYSGLKKLDFLDQHNYIVVLMIPQLIDIGNGCPWPVLPPGVHKTTLGKIESTFAYTPHRKRLFTGFRNALSDLKQAGCKSVYLNGSYTTGKNHPEDFDACWDPTGVEPGKLDPVLLDFSNQRNAQKKKV